MQLINSNYPQKWSQADKIKATQTNCHKGISSIPMPTYRLAQNSGKIIFLDFATSCHILEWI